MKNDQFLILSNFTDYTKLEKAATREGYGDALVELGEINPKVVVLTADVAESMRTHKFAERYPARFFEMGVAEQNMMGVAAGLALAGKVPFVSAYAVFSPGRNWDQLRVSVCYSKNNVKVVGGHTGVTVGPDGATHQALEDLAITRCLPNLMVLAPCDYWQAKQAVLAAAAHQGPVYIRVGREPSPILTGPETPFQLGKARVVIEGDDVTLVACGPLLAEALLAAQKLHKLGIEAEVIDNPSIKPLDEKTLLKSVAKTKAVVTIEEHQVMGGMGSAIAEMLGQNYPVPLEMIGVKDSFGQSGKAAELLQHYRLTHPYIVKAAQQVIGRKKR